MRTTIADIAKAAGVSEATVSRVLNDRTEGVGAETRLRVKAVMARSFERIHRSNLVGMGVLPLQFKEGTTAQTLKLDGTETCDVLGLGPALQPQQDLTLCLTRRSGEVVSVPVRCRIDTPVEIDYYRHGGILPYVLRQIIAKNRTEN